MIPLSPPCGGRCHGVTEGGSAASDQIVLEMGSPPSAFGISPARGAKGTYSKVSPKVSRKRNDARQALRPLSGRALDEDPAAAVRIVEQGREAPHLFASLKSTPVSDHSSSVALMSSVRPSRWLSPAACRRDRRRRSWRGRIASSLGSFAVIERRSGPIGSSMIFSMPSFSVYHWRAACWSDTWIGTMDSRTVGQSDMDTTVFELVCAVKAPDRGGRRPARRARSARVPGRQRTPTAMSSPY